MTRDFAGEIIENYLLAELRANGLLDFEDGVFIYRGQRDYLIEIKALSMGDPEPKSVRLREPFDEAREYYE